VRVASLDLGTNTFLCLISEVENGVIQKVLTDQVRVVRLGQGVNKTRRLHPDALKRADECFKEFAKIIADHRPDRVLAFATSAARDVQNANELFELGKRYSIPIQVISGEQEAECTFAGTIDSELTNPVAIVDVGGGSTEFIIGDRTGIKFRTSLDIGSVRLTERFITCHPIKDDELKNLEQHLSNETASLKSKLGALPKELKPAKVIAVAGTPTTLATVDMGLPFESERVHGYKLPLSKMKMWADRMTLMTVEERQKLAGMEPKRADVIVAGALTLLRSCEVFECSEVEVSIRGLRYGIAKLISQGAV
jgi:exopolyphosphatase / guanosine-5'-triphosphate,3'-diphosphate pyrophosphatase